MIQREVRERARRIRDALEMVDPKDVTKMARLQGEIQALRWLEGQEMQKVVEDAFTKRDEA